ncbi:MAG: hypothetical protein IJ570_08260 [Prevotella sp.]|nr:hypothetical protein [Prevotella sp.]
MELKAKTPNFLRTFNTITEKNSNFAGGIYGVKGVKEVKGVKDISLAATIPNSAGYVQRR